MSSLRGQEDGRHERFLDLFEVHYGLIVAFAVRRGLRGADAEDLAADVFLTAWRRLDSAPEPSLLWLYAIAHRTLGNHWVLQRPAGPIGDPPEDDAP